MNYILERNHPRRGNYHNSPLRDDWRRVGVMPAKNASEAIAKGIRATGAPASLLRITGIATRVP